MPLRTQNIDEWLEARKGKVTASKMSDLMAKGAGVTRRNYMAKLMAERLTGEVEEGFTSADMDWGRIHENDAILAYALLTSEKIGEVDFVAHPSITMAGATPDGFVGDDGLIEIKCPKTSTHLETIETDSIDRKYMLQIQFQLVCAEKKWCDYVTYDPRLKGTGLELYIIRVMRDEAIIQEIETAVHEFLVELEGRMAVLLNKVRGG